MKSTIIILGIAALSFNTSSAANECNTQNVNQQEVAVVNGDSTQQFNWGSASQALVKAGVENNTEETTFFNPTAVIKVSHTKTMEEVVSENKLITDSQEEVAQPLSIEKTQLDYINEDNQIIESNPNDQVYPLDFEAINRTMKNEKVASNNLAVTVDLKL